MFESVAILLLLYIYELTILSEKYSVSVSLNTTFLLFVFFTIFPARVL